MCLNSLKKQHVSESNWFPAKIHSSEITYSASEDTTIVATAPAESLKLICLQLQTAEPDVFVVDASISLPNVAVLGGVVILVLGGIEFRSDG